MLVEYIFIMDCILQKILMQSIPNLSYVKSFEYWLPFSEISLLW